MSDLDPLDPTIASLLADERAAPDPLPADVAARVVRSVRSRVDLGGDRDGDGGRDGGGGSGGAGSTVRRIASLGAAFVIGVGVGSVLLPRRGEERIVYVEREVAPPASASAPIADGGRSAPLPAPSGPPSASTTLIAPTAPTASSPSGAGAAESERALLDVARVRYANGELDQALDAVTRAERTWPHGQLEEEREALAVKILVALGRERPARARGERFLARWPHSVFAPAVRASLKSFEADANP